MNSTIVRFFIRLSYGFKGLTDPAVSGSPYDSHVVYEKPADFKKYFNFRKRLGFRF